MAKKRTLGKAVEAWRKKGERRIARLERTLQSNVSERTRKWASERKKKIEGAIQRTRQYNPKTGKKYKKSKRYIERGLSVLEREVEKVEARFNIEGDTFEATQRELNKASVGIPSVYTKAEAKIFYRATQKIWQKQSVGEHGRNEAILDYFNEKRENRGLSSVSLSDIVEAILKKNEEIKRRQDINPREPMDEKARKDYENAQQGDNADEQAGSPPGITNDIIRETRDAFDSLFTPIDVDEIK